jgi:hypothetical protein
VDHLPVTVIASGSASFELADRLSEPMTGRARTFHLYPLSWEEAATEYRLTSPETALEEMLRFGMYPRVHTMEGNEEKEEYLYNYLNQYLYRDILEYGQIKKPRKVVDLLILLAHLRPARDRSGGGAGRPAYGLRVQMVAQGQDKGAQGLGRRISRRWFRGRDPGKLAGVSGRERERMRDEDPRSGGRTCLSKAGTMEKR